MNWTINTIKDAVRNTGSHWFDPDTMSSFGTEVLPSVYQGPGGIFFVTQDNQYRPELPKRYTVRCFRTDTLELRTVGEVCEYRNANFAKDAAKQLAKGENGELVETNEEFKPVTVLEQFLFDLDKHSSDASKVTETDAKRMMTHAKVHHRLMELLCSDEHFCKDLNEEGEHPRILANRKLIMQCAKRLGAKSVLFSNDPRGCTVKIVFVDGYTNDFNKEGYCVPTGD